MGARGGSLRFMSRIACLSNLLGKIAHNPLLAGATNAYWLGLLDNAQQSHPAPTCLSLTTRMAAHIVNITIRSIYHYPIKCYHGGNSERA